MTKSTALQLLLTTLLCVLSTEGAFANDLDKVLTSQKTWEKLKAVHHGNYQYVVKWQGFAPIGHETTIYVRDNQVIGRKYRTFANGQRLADETVPEAWEESADDLGSHKHGAPPRTLDAIYQEAIKVARRKLEGHEKRYVTFNKQGLILKCNIDDERIADEDHKGIDLASITLDHMTPLRLSTENNGQTFQVPVGSAITVQLASNRTTGFSWNNATQSTNLKLVGEIQYEAKRTLPGSGGSATVNFLASQLGKGTLTLEYKRVFEDKPAAKTFQVTIEVRKKSPVTQPEKIYQAPNGKKFPTHWGAPPKIQTRDLRPLPGGYGKGSGTLAKWIQTNLDRDSKH
ncbi:MAG: protease inhibitor I42 family protein [Mariniblastus sp.]|nr:protease inhibitor I42 family protein [Mariniblastus sp.]